MYKLMGFRVVKQAPDDGIGQGGGGATSTVASTETPKPQEQPPRVAAPTGDHVVTAYELELRQEAQKHRQTALEAKAKADALAAELAAERAANAKAKEDHQAALAAKETELKGSFENSTKMTAVRLYAKDLLQDVDEITNLPGLDKLKLNADGTIEGAKEYFDGLQQKRPYLFKDFYKAATSTGRRTVPQVPGNEDPKPESVLGLSEEDYKKKKAEMLRANRTK